MGRLCSNNEAECGLRAVTLQTDLGDAVTQGPALNRLLLAVRQEPAAEGFASQAPALIGTPMGERGHTKVLNIQSWKRSLKI